MRSALVVVVLLCLGITASAAQTVAGLWGSPLYRVQLTVTGTSITGTFAALDNPQAPSGAITGKLLPSGKAFTADWTFPVGVAGGTFQTSLGLTGRGGLLSGYRWTEETEPRSFALHRAMNGQLVAVLSEDSADAATPTTGANTRATTGTTAPPAAPATAPAPAGKLFTLTAPSQGFVLNDTYPRADFDMEFEVTCTQPGTIFDTMGLNIAPQGSWSVSVTGDNRLAFNLWDRGPWRILNSQATISRGKATKVRLLRRGPMVQFFIGGTPDTTASLPTPLSGKPIYVGDFKGDEQWGAAFRIYQGLVGTVRVLYLGDPRP